MSAIVDMQRPVADSFSKQLRWLYGTQLTGIKLGLDNMRRLLGDLGFEDTPGRFPPIFLHVAGTNGKGSVSAMLDALCRATGLRTGLYTSPHLVSFCERIRVDGVPISRPNVAEGIEQLRKLTRRWENPPTFFELTTALALDHFRAERAEVIVWETGLGGRLDATNVVHPVVSVLTPVALDHQNYLGHTLGEVAAEKAGIIKPGVPVVSATQDPLVEQIFRVTASTHGSPLEFVDGSWTGPLGLEGDHQRNNAALAIASMRAARLPLDDDEIADALRTVSWPGRFQILEQGRLVLDGAHNPGAASRLAETWRQHFGPKKASVIMAMMRDKDAISFSRALEPVMARAFTLAARNPRSHSAESLRALVSGVATAEGVDNLRDALDRARGFPEPILICGSLYLVGEALALVAGENPPEETWQ